LLQDFEIEQRPEPLADNFMSDSLAWESDFANKIELVLLEDILDGSLNP